MPQHVTFESFSPVMFRDAAKHGLGERTTACGEFYLPESGGDGLAAVVVMLGLGGPKDARERAYGEFFEREGYAALVVNSYATRDALHLGHNMRALSVTEAMMCADAFAALRFLASHPRIDGDKICIIGFSYGGMISVLTAHAQIRDLFTMGDEVFAGHIAFYGCSVIRLEDPRATGKPVLIVVGEKDCNVSIERSRRIADDLRRGGSQVIFQVLDGAYHQWDSDDVEKRFVRFNLHGCNAWLGTDNDLRDEGTGIRLRGRLSRGALLLFRVGLDGYHILRDEDALTRSDALLLEFLARVRAGEQHSENAPRAEDATTSDAGASPEQVANPAGEPARTPPHLERVSSRPSTAER